MGRSLSHKPLDVLKVDDRRVLNGIFWVLWLGFPWRDLPDCDALPFDRL